MKDCAAQNQIYRLVWNRARGVWMVVSELAEGQGKGNGRGKQWLMSLVFLILFSLSSSLAMAAPTGGQVTSGTGSISQSGSTTTIHQSSQNLSVSWKTFNVGSSETVNFKQPNASAVAVNRIHDTNGSQIMGHINANGNIYLINPNGILFGKSAQVNVGGLVASTLDTADGVHFSGSGTGSVVNEGTINAQHYVALLGKSVINSGVITARLGTVAMGAGNDVSLTFSGNDLVGLQVNQSVIDSLVANHGLIEADGGMVIMNAGARYALLASVVNNGFVEAQTVDNHSGTITLLGGMTAGEVSVGGTLDASAPHGGNGGHIETSAAHVHIASDAKITTAAASGLNGSWLIDPVDFTIAASGGDMTGAAVDAALANGNFTIKSSGGSSGTAGDINVNDAVSWSANTLTLNAQNNININNNMDATGAAGLALQYGQSSSSGGSSNYYVNAPVNLASTASFSTQKGSGGSTINWTIIDSLGSSGSTTGTDLQGINGNLAGHYVLGANIDASATSGWTNSYGTGFLPIGNYFGTSSNPFTGSFDGLGHTISSLYIKSSSNNDIALFGYVAGSGSSNLAVVRNVGLIGGSMAGTDDVGALVGYANQASLSNDYATSSVSGSSSVGGLVGAQGYGSISNSYATGSATASSTGVGGLVGSVSYGSISNSYSTGKVTAGGSTASLGGFIGSGSGETLSNNYWDSTTSNISTGFGSTNRTGITSLTDTQMKQQSNFSGLDFSNTWVMYNGQTYPLLRSFLTRLTVTANAAAKTYDGTAYSGGNGVSYSVTPNSGLIQGTIAYSGTAQGAVNAGSYTIIPSGLYSYDQQGYIIDYANGTLTIDPAQTSSSRTSSSQTSAANSTVTYITKMFTTSTSNTNTNTSTASSQQQSNDIQLSDSSTDLLPLNRAKM